VVLGLEADPSHLAALLSDPAEASDPEALLSDRVVDSGPGAAPEWVAVALEAVAEADPAGADDASLHAFERAFRMTFNLIEGSSEPSICWGHSFFYLRIFPGFPKRAFAVANRSHL
jgi:hypothetical protein